MVTRPVNDLPTEDFSTRLPADIADVVAGALAEDIGPGDRHAALVAGGTRASAQVVAKEAGVLAGRAWFEAVFAQLDPSVQVRWQIDEGAALKPDSLVCELSGDARALLAGERTALNFLQLLSGTASATRRFVERVKGTRAGILDTRKTLPGLRAAQKYAVALGGGLNHRFGLYDRILIKENHIAAAGSIAEAMRRLREANPDLPVQVEVEDLNELDAALDADADAVLLDNFPTHILARAVNKCRRHLLPNRRHVITEASGDITLANVRDVADTEVERISIGGLTKNVTAIDLSLRLRIGD